MSPQSFATKLVPFALRGKNASLERGVKSANIFEKPLKVKNSGDKIPFPKFLQNNPNRLSCVSSREYQLKKSQNDISLRAQTTTLVENQGH